MAKLIKVDHECLSEAEIIEVENSAPLEFYQRVVNGNIQALYSEAGTAKKHLVMLIDEDGKFRKTHNPVATNLAREEFNLPHDDFIAGNALICEYPKEFN